MKKILLVLATLLFISGCLSTVSNGDSTSETETPSIEITNKVAEERALESERQYILSSIDRYDEYGVGVGDATVTNRTAKGVYVNVTFPYWYDSGEVHTDSVSDARYFINDTATVRIEGTYP